MYRVYPHYKVPLNVFLLDTLYSYFQQSSQSICHIVSVLYSLIKYVSYNLPYFLTVIYILTYHV
jgi:hypothetical protein